MCVYIYICIYTISSLLLLAPQSLELLISITIIIIIIIIMITQYIKILYFLTISQTIDLARILTIILHMLLLVAL